jgi:hypothetical protein
VLGVVYQMMPVILLFCEKFEYCIDPPGRARSKAGRLYEINTFSVMNCW